MTAKPEEIRERLRDRLGGDLYILQEVQGFISYACQRANGEQVVGVITSAARLDAEKCAEAIIEATRPQSASA